MPSVLPRHKRLSLILSATAFAVLASVVASAVPDSTTAATASFGSGVQRVGRDITAGTYRTRSSRSDCYWERLRGFTGDFSQIIANDFRESGRAIVTIKSTDKGFSSSRCGTWTKI